MISQIGTGLDGYGKNPHISNNDIYDDIPPTDSTISDTAGGDVDSTTTGVGIDGDLGSSGSSSSAFNMAVPSYRASANGTQCLNCIPGKLL